MTNTKCAICRKEFEEKDQRVTGNERTFHADCFKCETCKRSLVNDSFTEEAQTKELEVPDMFVPMHVEIVQVCCVECTKKSKYKSCFGCKERFEVTSTIVRAHRHSWHPQCFRCAGCNEVVNLEFFVRDGKHYCPKPACGGIHVINLNQAWTSPSSAQKTQPVSGTINPIQPSATASLDQKAQPATGANK